MKGCQGSTALVNDPTLRLLCSNEIVRAMATKAGTCFLISMQHTDDDRNRTWMQFFDLRVRPLKADRASMTGSSQRVFRLPKPE